MKKLVITVSLMIVVSGFLCARVMAEYADDSSNVPPEYNTYFSKVHDSTDFFQKYQDFVDRVFGVYFNNLYPQEHMSVASAKMSVSAEMPCYAYVKILGMEGSYKIKCSTLYKLGYILTGDALIDSIHIKEVHYKSMRIFPTNRKYDKTMEYYLR